MSELNSNPFLKLVIFYILGSIISLYTSINTTNYLSFILLIPFVLLIFINRKYLKNNSSIFCNIILFLTLITGFLLHKNFNELNYKSHFSNYKFEYFEAKIINEPVYKNDLILFHAEVDKIFSDKWISTNGKINFTIKKDTLSKLNLNYGSVILSSSTINNTTPPLNPGEFDFKFWLSTKNIFHSSFANEFQIKTLANFKGNYIQKLAYEIRKVNIEKYKLLIKNPEALSIASTLIFGYRAELSSETLEAFSLTGTIHALSVSGAHVAIIYVFLNYLFFFLNNNRTLKFFKFLIIIIILWFYVFITGFSPPALRAVIMISLLITADTFNNQYSSINIMAFSALILLLFNPFYISDVGFQLSYTAVLGLIILQPEIEKLISIKSPFLKSIWALIAMSLAAQIGTLPLSLYYFHQFPVYFLIGNLFIALPINLIMGLGVVVLIPGFGFLGPVLDWCITFTYNGLIFISSLPFSSVQKIQIDIFQVLIIVLIISAITLSLKIKSSTIKISLITSFLILITYNTILKLSKKNTLLFYSLKQNIGIGIIQNNKLNLYTNLNSEEKIFKNVILPGITYLKIKDYQINNLELPKINTTHSHYLIANPIKKLLIIDNCVVKAPFLPKGYDYVLFQGFNSLSNKQNLELILNNKFVLFARQPTHLNLHQLPEILKNKTYLLYLNPSKAFKIE